MSQIGQRAKQLRLARGESQENVARRANITNATYNRIENGHNEPSIETAKRIAAAFEVSLDYLVNGDPVSAA